VDGLASFVEYYLPVFIPVFLTVISVLAGIVTKRIELNLNSLLKIHSDLVLGLFSFVIWALVAYQQTGRIDLNADASISLIRVVLLLFGNVMLLIAGLIILNIKWEQWPTLWAKRNTKRWENTANGGFLFAAFLAVFAPIWLAKPRPQSPPAEPPRAETFVLSIPYVDSSIPRQVGAGRWANRVLCEVTDITANSAGEAALHASKYLESLGRMTPVFSLRPPGSVVVLKDSIVIMRR
jgi:hypothetical protein